MAYKFYFCTFVNKVFQLPENKILCKFGITHHSDVLRRFNPSIDDGYTKSQKYLDWNIACDFSMRFNTKEEAEAEEKRWLTEVFPNPGPTKVWVEKILKCPTMDYYSETTGISELRLLTLEQRKWALDQMYNMRKKHYA